MMIRERCYRGRRDTLFAYTLDVYRRANLRSGLDTVPPRVYRLAKVFPKKRRGDEKFTRFRSRKKVKRRGGKKSREREREKGGKLYFVLVRWHVSRRRRALFRLPSRDVPYSPPSRPTTCHLVVYFRCVRALFPFSLLWHLRNTKADLPEFYVSKHVIVLATRLRRVCSVVFISILHRVPAFPLSERREKGCIWHVPTVFLRIGEILLTLRLYVKIYIRYD